MIIVGLPSDHQSSLMVSGTVYCFCINNNAVEPHLKTISVLG